MPTFYRYRWTQFWLRLSSDESLGVLDSAYIEDYDGVDGQLTLRLEATGDRTPILMGESSDESAPHEVFVGSLALDTLANGTYAIEGRVRDVVGNYTILSEIASPVGSEQVLPLAFVIADGVGYVVDFGPVELRGDLVFALPARDTTLPLVASVGSTSLDLAPSSSTMRVTIARPNVIEVVF